MILLKEGVIFEKVTPDGLSNNNSNYNCSSNNNNNNTIINKIGIDHNNTNNKTNGELFVPRPYDISKHKPVYHEFIPGLFN